MDERRIDFIICVRENNYYEECMRYIADLVIPEGYRIDVLTVFDAEAIMKQCRQATRDIRFICGKTPFC